MRWILILCLLCVTKTFAGEGRAYPLWDGKEAVAEYARRVGLPATKTVDLGKGVTLEMVLIPAGRFVMGTDVPKKPINTVEEAGLIMAMGGGLLFLCLAVLIFKNAQKRQTSFSLSWLLMFTASGGLFVGGAVRLSPAFNAAAQYERALARYNERLYHEMRSHPVTLSQPFYMGKYTVTQAQYASLMGGDFTLSSQLPATGMTWSEADIFCKRLSDRVAGSGDQAHLPTEAQWEYACRAGTTTAYYSGDAESDLSVAGWYSANSRLTVHSVGLKKPNEFGLYDMHGNVRQWCADNYTAHYEIADDLMDPFYDQGTFHVLRGGSRNADADECRAAHRDGMPPSFLSADVGFRVVVSARGVK